MNTRWYLIFLFSLFLLCVGCKHSSTNFQQSKWIEARKTESWQTRKEMAKDLINRKIIFGKSEAEVKSMLGNPENYSDVPKNELYYLIDEDYGFDIDPVKIEYLIIYFGSNKIVTKTIIKTINCGE